MNHIDYHNAEMKRTIKHLDTIRKAPLADRKEAKTSLVKAFTEYPNIFADRIGWLLNGTYGYGEMQLALNILKGSKRTNKVAALSQLMALVEWQCPEDMTRSAWKSLTREQQEKLDYLIRVEIDYIERGEDE